MSYKLRVKPVKVQRCKSIVNHNVNYINNFKKHKKGTIITKEIALHIYILNYYYKLLAQSHLLKNPKYVTVIDKYFINIYVH